MSSSKSNLVLNPVTRKYIKKTSKVYRLLNFYGLVNHTLFKDVIINDLVPSKNILKKHVYNEMITRHRQGFTVQQLTNLIYNDTIKKYGYNRFNWNRKDFQFFVSYVIINGIKNPDILDILKEFSKGEGTYDSKIPIVYSNLQKKYKPIGYTRIQGGHDGLHVEIVRVFNLILALHIPRIQ